MLELLADIERELDSGQDESDCSPEEKLASSDWEAKSADQTENELYKDLEGEIRLSNQMLHELDDLAQRNSSLLERTNSRFQRAVMSTSNSCLVGLIIVLVLILGLLLKHS